MMGRTRKGGAEKSDFFQILSVKATCVHILKNVFTLLSCQLCVVPTLDWRGEGVGCGAQCRAQRGGKSKG